MNEIKSLMSSLEALDRTIENLRNETIEKRKALAERRLSIVLEEKLLAGRWKALADYVFGAINLDIIRVNGWQECPRLFSVLHPPFGASTLHFADGVTLYTYRDAPRIGFHLSTISFSEVEDFVCSQGIILGTFLGEGNRLQKDIDNCRDRLARLESVARIFNFEVEG